VPFLRLLFRSTLVGIGVLCGCTLRAAPPDAEHPQKQGKAVSRAEKPHPAETSPQKPEPPVATGPSLPPDRTEIAQQAQRLCDAIQTGCLRLTNPTRESEQLHCLMNAGAYFWPVSPPPAPASRATLPSRQGKSSRRTPTDAAALPENSVPAAEATSATEDPGTPAEVASQPSPNLLRMLTALTANATPAHPLELMSLLRPPYQTARFQHAGPRNPHSLGLAADIAAYDGYRIRQDRPEDCVRMALALLRDLPPGRYRFGMPKAPETPAIVGAPQLPAALIEALRAVTPADALPALPPPPPDPAPRGVLPSRRQPPTVLPTPPLSVDVLQHGAFGAALGLYVGTSGKPWPFFPPPECEMENGVVAPLREKGNVVLDAKGLPMPHIVRFRNESYAPEEDLADLRLCEALAAARKRGVDVIALFPDGADHIHVDVKQER